ncbi:alpha-glucan family phosphorylase [uncultured Jatrophihabitans sp.]|uniref:alpha-glucan family phosphorylase n=1 Tax=uncultured Jatrophihabitans sp. TaxID=1610747 RepID=UPI0035CB1043
MKALRRLTVRAAFPPELRPLGKIVANLRWSWHADSLDLLQAVDPELWQSCGHDPGRMLGEITAERFATLAQDRRFLRRLNDVADDLAEYLSAPRWYQRQDDPTLPASIAYFSPEFGITEVLPQYSGGLGILAGDHLKAASDLGVPIIGVGLLYGAGYFRQSLSRDGWQLEHYPSLDPQGLPIIALSDADGAPARVAIALPESRTLHAAIWVAQVGRVPLLLLDSDIEENDADARQVTDRLYGGGKEHRLEQELLLGVGGVRAIRAYCAATGTPAPAVFHTNEGHAGFLGVERIRELVDSDGLSFDEALRAVRAGTVFTTHTPVPAGIDRFERDLVAAHLTGIAGPSALSAERILALGAEEDPAIFNMAHMGLRLGQRANGVSLLHGEVSRGMFAGLWPGFDVSEVPISSVTNGVHAPTWMSREMTEIAEREVGAAALESGGGWDAIDKVDDAELWKVRNTLRAQLVGEIRRRVQESSLVRGMAPAELGWTASTFDPAVLTIGFARRVPSYKRLTLMLRDPERLRALLLDPQRPVQIVIAGKSHPADDGGKQLIAQMVRFADDPAVRHRITFLPDYDIGMARYLYWGVDVWLNNPLRPLEACGTSGMKAALNGALNLSIMDGWWDEWFDGDNGWAIPSADGVSDPDHRDDLEANALYELIQNNVAPRFYDRQNGVPTRWVQMVRHTLTSLGPKVLASRMVREYVTRLYAPAAASAAQMAADDYAAARSLASWSRQVVDTWPQVAVLHVDSQLSGAGDAQVGQSLALRAEVALGPLQPEDVEVEAVYGPVDAEDRLTDISTLTLQPVEVDGVSRWEGEVPLRRTGAFGYTVRVLPKHPLLASPAELGVVSSA